MVRYNYAYDKPRSDPNRKLVLALNRERIIRNHCGFQWAGKIHETIDLNGEKRIGKLDGLSIEHDTAEANEARREGRNLRIFDQYIDLNTASLHDLFQYGGELQGAREYQKAVDTFDQYIKVYGDTIRDSMGERYVVLIKKAECHRLLKQDRKAIEACGLALGDDPSRAEAYGMIGMTCYEAGQIPAAFAAFLAAAACKAPTHGGLTFEAFYGPAIREMLDTCKDQLKELDVQLKA